MWFRVPPRLALSLTIVALLVGGSAPPATAEFSPAQRGEIEAIIKDYLTKNPDLMLDLMQAAQDKIKSDAHEKAVAALATHRRELLEDANAPVAGNPKGDVTMVEFFDYRCPYCQQVTPALDKLLAEDKQLRFVYKEFPVLGAASVLAAKAALAARRQGKYDAVHRVLMTIKGQMDETAILRAVGSVGVDVDRLKRDMAAPEIEAMLNANRQLADALGINGTPAFIVGDEIVPGAASLATLRQLVEVARFAK